MFNIAAYTLLRKYRRKKINKKKKRRKKGRKYYYYKTLLQMTVACLKLGEDIFRHSPAVAVIEHH